VSIEAAGAEPLFLPPYSPDLNPTELVFSKLQDMPQNEQSMRSGTASANSWITSRRSNATTLSATAVMLKPDREMLPTPRTLLSLTSLATVHAIGKTNIEQPYGKVQKREFYARLICT
jgi:hypothetical protein